MDEGAWQATVQGASELDATELEYTQLQWMSHTIKTANVSDTV